MTKDTFAKGMTLLKEAFPNKKINPQVYYEVLRDLTDDQFIGAVKTICNEHQTMFPDDNLMAIIRARASGTQKDIGLIAWGLVRQAISRHGAYSTVTFEIEGVNRAINMMGGWIKLCAMTIEEEPFRRKDFLELHEIACRNDDGRTEKLVGLFGDAVPKVIKLIVSKHGDEVKRLQ